MIISCMDNALVNGKSIQLYQRRLDVYDFSMIALFVQKIIVPL